MQDAVLHVLTVWTVWYILAWSDVPGYKRVRNDLLLRFETLKEMVQCPLCFGFWISLLLAALFPSPVVPFIQLVFIGSGGCYILDKVIARLESE